MRRAACGVLRYCHSSPLRTILQLLCLHKCQHQALSALSAIVSAQSRNRIPFSVFRIPYAVFRMPWLPPSPSLPSLTPFPYLQLHSTSSLVPTMLLLWDFSPFFSSFLIYQLQSVMWLTFGNTGQRLVTLFCGHSNRPVNHGLVKLNLIADKK